MCRDCWARVPLKLRTAVIRAYAGGRGEGSPEHAEAAQAAVEAAHEAWLTERRTVRIGQLRARALEAKIRNELDYRYPLHYCHSYFHWNVRTLADLTPDQEAQLLARLRVAVPEARAQIRQEQQERDRKARQFQEGPVYRG